jgi:hypothetical protein
MKRLLLFSLRHPARVFPTSKGTRNFAEPLLRQAVNRQEPTGNASSQDRFIEQVRRFIVQLKIARA